MTPDQATPDSDWPGAVPWITAKAKTATAQIGKSHAVHHDHHWARRYGIASTIVMSVLNNTRVMPPPRQR